MAIKNAKITSTMLGREDHGILTFMVYITFDSGVVCGVGGYHLDEYNAKTKTRVFSVKSMEIISKILEVVGVDAWEDLLGQYIRVEDDGWGSFITKIGNLIDDKWIDFSEFFSVRGENDVT